MEARPGRACGVDMKGEKTPVKPYQVAFGQRWDGYWFVVRNVDEAMRAVGAIP